MTTHLKPFANPPGNFVQWCTRLMIFFFISISVSTFGQTNPAAQTLPYSQDFSGLAHTSTTYPTGWVGWTISAAPGAGFNLTGPSADRLLTANSTASTTSGNVHNYNGKIGSLNTGSLDLCVATAINTTGLTTIIVGFDVMTIRNPYDGATNTRINEVILQYRVGTTGAWTNVTGTEYQNNTTTQTTAVTTPQNSSTKSITLPVGAENQAVVQLRWASRQVSGGGSRPSFAIDNVTVSGSAAAPSITVSTTSLPDFGNVQTGNTSSEQSYTVSGLNLTAPIAISAPSGFEVSLSSGSGFSSGFSLTPSSGAVPITTIFVHFIPGATGPFSGTIDHVSAGATTRSVAVSGTGTSCSAPTITAGGPTSFCTGGSVTLTSTAGASYLWSTSETTQSIVVSTSGSYTVTMTDGGGCTATSAPTVVTENAFGVTGTLFSENVGTPLATTTVNAYTGWQNQGIYSYSSSTTPQADVRTTTASSGYAGASAGGNIFLGFSTLPTPSLRDITISGINTLHYTSLTLSFGMLRSPATDPLTVEVSSDGTVWTALSFTQPPTTAWTLITPTGSIPATANLRIRFSKGQNSTQFRIDDINLTGTANQLEITATTPTTFCDGQYAVLVSNIPTGNSWSPDPAFTQAVNVYTANSFYTTVTDGNGCTAVSNVITTSVNPSPTVFATNTSPLCWMGNDGTADAFGSGGTAPLTYSWSTSPVQTTASISSLVAGTYTVTVTDATGCSSSSPTTVVDGIPITATTSTTDATCFGDYDGSVTASGTSGVGPYTYVWDTINKSGLPFAVSVTPKSAAHPFFGLGHPSGYLVDGVEGKEITLVRGLTYYFDVNATGFPFIISTDSVGGDTLNEITSGVFNSRVQAGTLQFTPSNSLPSLLYYTCSTQQYLGFRIRLVNGPTGATLTGLGAGNYSALVTDANGCTGMTTATVNQPGLIEVTTYFPSTSGFVGDIIQVIGSGFTTVTDVLFNGVSSPAFTVDNYFQITAEVPVGATTGQVTVVIGSCSGVSTTPFTIITCTAPTISAGGPTTFCSPGSVTLTSSANTSYLWSPTNETTQSITVSTSGTYYVTTTDGVGCTASSTPVTIVVNNYAGYAGPAYSENFGTPTANTFVHLYTGWQNNGTYSYTSPSANFCDLRTSGASSGYLGVSGSGNVFFGTATSNPRTFVISGINTENYTGLSLQFGLLRANVAACTTEVMVVEVSSDGIVWTPLTYTQPTLNVWTLITPTGTIPAVPNLSIRFSKTSCAQFRIDDVKINGTTTQVSIVASGPTNICNGQSVRLVSSIPAGNTWSPNGETTTHANAMTSGTYFTTVADVNGCTIVSNSIAVNVSPAIAVTTTPTNVLCFGQTTGSALASVSGGTPPFTFSWNTAPVQTVDNATNLAAGIYTVTATDSYGCTSTASATITEPAAIALSTTQVNVSCFGGSNGSIDLTVAGGTPGYSFLWSNGALTEDVSGLNAGTYSVTVTDLNLCTAVISVTITEPVALALSTTQSNVSCFGGTNGSIDLSVTGGTPAFTYLWSNGALTEDVSGLNAGTYSVTVTDLNGCTSSVSATITEPSALSLSTTQIDVSCFGGTNGSIDLTVSGGTPGYSFLWSNSEVTEDIAGLVAGSYSVLVTDLNGCTASTSVTITEPADIVISSFAPGTGSAGTPVIITGSGFVGITGVQFNGISATFTVDNVNQISTTVPVGATTGFITVYTPSCLTNSSTQFVVPTVTVDLTVKAYIQGYYVSGSPMNAALFNSGISGSGTDCDTLHVCLMDPSMLISMECFDGILQTDGTLLCSFSGAFNGNSFYLRLTHHNGLETWSANPVTLGLTPDYDFTISDTSAYGNNMVLVDPNTWALWSGDCSNFGSPGQDGFIESSDYSAIENDSQNFVFGYGDTDLTGDALVESSDYSIVENNSQLFVITSHP